jgi:hypothetical protein
MEILKMFCYTSWGIAGLAYAAWLVTGVINGKRLADSMLSDEEEA